MKNLKPKLIKCADCSAARGADMWTVHYQDEHSRKWSQNASHSPVRE